MVAPAHREVAAVDLQLRERISEQPVRAGRPLWTLQLSTNVVRILLILLFVGVTSVPFRLPLDVLKFQLSRLFLVSSGSK